MAERTYSYVGADFPAGKLNPMTFDGEIRGSSIVTALDRVDTTGGSITDGVVSGAFTASVVMKDALSAADRATLDGADQEDVLAIQTDAKLDPRSTTVPNVLNIQTDATLDPGATPTTGDRHLLKDSANLHANFGSISGVADNDIVQYDGANFIVSFDASSNASAKVENDADGSFHDWNGTAWSAGVAGNLGDRYLLTNTAALHAAFGTITGVGNNDIVEHDGSGFVVSMDASATGSAKVQNSADDSFHDWNGTAWSAGSPTGLVATHDNAVVDTSIAAKPKLGPEGVTLSRPQPQKIGWEMCNKDIRVRPGKFDQASSVEDLKVNITNKQEEDWAGPELTLVGVYKSDGTACTDQEDADSNGVCTIWDYEAIDQKDGTTKIAYDVRGGCLVADSGLPVGELWGHKAYLVAAPDIPAASGGAVRLFDGYLRADERLEEISPQAKTMDPAVATGANALRLYIFHPAPGSPAPTYRSHVFRLLTYRPTTTS